MKELARHMMVDFLPMKTCAEEFEEALDEVVRKVPPGRLSAAKA
jgi:hypothetical protein